ncbi:mycothiol transferase [Streptomyces silvisoli]|uniref:DUF664 domain-containing protein n=1 Tax=Streptomyces silvisoli TaxID=3034235 RepID=A0ABT5ZLL4_9ACTN|nr:DUF664 domain-containing protein [Streptomyces silvisoli]MDF3290714.1 DUF664 domain-containing protein [Streptomyces silvisoli]
MLTKHRHFLHFTTRDLTDELAGQRTTAIELYVATLIRHVSSMERTGELHRGGLVGAARLHRHGRGGLGPAVRRLPATARRDARRVLDAYAEVARKADELATSRPGCQPAAASDAHRARGISGPGRSALRRTATH